MVTSLRFLVVAGHVGPDRLVGDALGLEFVAEQVVGVAGPVISDDVGNVLTPWSRRPAVGDPPDLLASRRIMRRFGSALVRVENIPAGAGNTA